MPKTSISWKSTWIYLKSQIEFWNLKIQFKSEKFYSGWKSILNMDPAEWCHVYVFQKCWSTKIWLDNFHMVWTLYLIPKFLCQTIWDFGCRLLQANTGGPRNLWFLVPKSNHEMWRSWIPRTVFSVKSPLLIFPPLDHLICIHFSRKV